MLWALPRLCRIVVIVLQCCCYRVGVVRYLSYWCRIVIVLSYCCYRVVVDLYVNVVRRTVIIMLVSYCCYYGIGSELLLWYCRTVVMALVSYCYRVVVLLLSCWCHIVVTKDSVRGWC